MFRLQEAPDLAVHTWLTLHTCHTCLPSMFGIYTVEIVLLLKGIGFSKNYWFTVHWFHQLIWIVPITRHEWDYDLLFQTLWNFWGWRMWKTLIKHGTCVPSSEKMLPVFFFLCNFIHIYSLQLTSAWLCSTQKILQEWGCTIRHKCDVNMLLAKKQSTSCGHFVAVTVLSFTFYFSLWSWHSWLIKHSSI